MIFSSWGLHLNFPSWYFQKSFSKGNLDITVIAAFPTKATEFGRLEFDVFIEVLLWLKSATLMANNNLLGNAERETWRYQTQFKLKTANRRQITKHFKAKVYKKASLETSLTNPYATKPVLQSKQKLTIGFVQNLKWRY